MNRVKFQIKSDVVEQALRELDRKVARKVIRQSIRAGLKPVLAEAKRLAPVRSGQVRKAIKLRAGRTRRGAIKLVVLIGAGDFVGKTFYGSFAEFGTKHQRAQHFMERAYHSKRTEAINITEARIRDGIEREARNSS